jgi:glycosyltransferase involved in cell wall biosynthesis
MMVMRIAIDATPVTYYGGVPVYTRNLINSLAQIDKNNDYILFYNSYKPFRISPIYIPQRNFRVVKEFLPGRVDRALTRFTPFSYSHLLRKVDILHTTDFTGYKLSRRERWIATVHDLIIVLFPEIIHKAIYEKIVGYLDNYLPSADYIITVSECSKRDIINVLDWPEERVDVVYEGVDFRLKPGTRQQVEKTLGFGEPYILAVSTLEPRKNYPRLFRAYELLREKVKTPIKLVIVGTPGWFYDEIFTAHKRNPFRNDIVILSNISAAQLGIIYSGAEIFVHASIYEGFGLPILEAQYMGKAVLAGNNSSIPEVVGDSALLIDVKDEEEILKGMLALLENHNLRNRLIKRGYENVKRFSWEKTARETLAIYQKVFDLRRGKWH